MHSDQRTDTGIFQLNYYIDGICNDSYDDWNELGVDNPNAIEDWSEVCWGSCYDSNINGNEVQSDYGGRCGQCNVGLKGNDLEWLLLQETGYLYFPFNESQCVEVQGATAMFTISMILMLAIIILIVIVFGVVAVPLILWMFGIKNPVWWLIRIIFGFFIGKSKKDNE